MTRVVSQVDSLALQGPSNVGRDRQCEKRLLRDWRSGRQPLSRHAAASGEDLLLLLLSRDRKSSCGDRNLGTLDGIQPCLPGFEHEVLPQSTRRLARSASCKGRPEDPIVRDYLRVLSMTGAPQKTIAAHRYQLRAVVECARRGRAGHAVRIFDLFRSPRLLGRALVDDRPRSGIGRVSKWTLAQRRVVIRSFARLMRPELLAVTGEEPEQVVAHALQSVAERVGCGYRLGGGTPRRRGGPAPSPEEVSRILDSVAKARSFQGRRNRAFFTILYHSGSRVDALRQLQGDDVIEMPDGHLRLLLHDKGKTRAREVELSADDRRLLFDYVEEFNWRAAFAGRSERIELGKPGAVWRSSWRRQWAYQGVRQTFEAACLSVGTLMYRLHAFRRTFATSAASVLPRDVVAQAGGWRGLERMDDHYIRPPEHAVLAKLREAEARDYSNAVAPL